jgi:hypothetical protein
MPPASSTVASLPSSTAPALRSRSPSVQSPLRGEDRDRVQRPPDHLEPVQEVTGQADGGNLTGAQQVS